MDTILSTVAPVVIVGGIAATVYVCSLKKSKNGKSKATKKAYVKSDDEDDKDEEDLLAKKPTKAPRQIEVIKIEPKKPKEKKVKAAAASTVVETPAPEPAPKAVVQPAQPEAPVLSKKEKKAAAAAAQAAPVKKEEPKKAETKKPEVKKELSEMELLKQRIAELEAKEKAAAAPKQDDAPMSNKQAKKAAKAAAAAAAAPAPAPTPPAAAAAKKDEKKKEHNPAPQLSEEQKKEQEELLAQFERENGQWREVPVYNGNKKKKAKDNFDYVDLSVLTTQSTMTAKFGDRFVLTQGENGSALEQITQTTGCKIELQPRPPKETMEKHPNRGADLPMKIELEGTEEQIKEARTIINELITKGFSTALSPDMSEARLRVDPSDHHHIIGKSGATINKLIDATGAKIVVPKAKDGESDDIIRIVGSTQAVAQAKEAIKSLITNGFSDLTHDNWKKVQLDFPAAYRRYILQGGANSIIRAIENTTTCKVLFPQSPSDNTVSIVGPAEKVDAASLDIKAVLTKLELPVNDVYLVGFDSADFKLNQLW